MLVAEPGEGKSIAIRAMKNVLGGFATNVAMSPDKVTPERLIKRLSERFLDTDAVREGQWSYGCYISELAYFLPRDPDQAVKFMAEMADLWDCPDTWASETIGREPDPLFYPYLSLLAGVQPEVLQRLMDQGMTGLGMPSRCLFVSTSETYATEYFGEDRMPAVQALVAGAEALLRMKGYAPFEPKAREVILEWEASKRFTSEGKPFNPPSTLEHYAKRRPVHLAKLALVHAAAEHPTKLVITKADVESAMVDLFDIEREMPKAMAAMGGNPYMTRELGVLRAVKEKCGAGNKHPVAEAWVRSQMGKLMSPLHVGLVLDEMIAKGALVQLAGTGPSPNRMLLPGKM